MGELVWSADIQEQIDAVRAKLLKKFGAAVAADAQRLAPVLTGLLKSETKSNETGSQVRANTDYAAPVEFGHRVVVSSEYGQGYHYTPEGTETFVPAQPFLRPAAYRKRDLS